MTSIRRHLTLGLLAAGALLLAASGVIVWLLVRGALLRQFDASLRSRAAFIQANVEEDDGQLQLELSLEPPGSSGAGMVPTFFQVWTADGVSVLKSESLGALDLPRPAADGLREVPSMASAMVPADQVLADGTRVRAVAARFDAADDKKGLFRNITLVTARTTAGIEATLRLLSGVLLGTGVTALVLMVPIIRWVLGRGLRPLGRLAERTVAIDVAHLDERLPLGDSPAELRPVVERLNDLLRRLEASFERERRFSSDVAHELRTPVAELKALGELGAAWPDQATPEAFAQVQAIAGEMEEMITRLTLLARAEAGTRPLALAVTRVDELVGEAVARCADTARGRDLTVERELEPVTLRTDPALLRMILSNLIGNAVHHAPAGSAIAVRCHSAGLVIRNRAPGLSAEDLPRLAERFWRKDESRSGYGHAGLGLSLAQSLAGLLGARLLPSLPEPGVLEMRLEWAADSRVDRPPEKNGAETVAAGHRPGDHAKVLLRASDRA